MYLNNLRGVLYGLFLNPLLKNIPTSIPEKSISINPSDWKAKKPNEYKKEKGINGDVRAKRAIPFMIS